MSGSQDPLNELLIDADEIDRTRLASTLKDFIGVDQRSGRVVLKSAYETLTTRQRVLVYLLGRKVSVLLGKLEAEEANSKLIQDETGLPRGTVGPKLKELQDAKIISKNDVGEFQVASHQIGVALQEFKKETSK